MLPPRAPAPRRVAGWVEVAASVGRATVIDNIRVGADGGGLAPPQLDHVVGSGQYGPLSETRRAKERDIMQRSGLPWSVIMPANGEPPSGLSRWLEREEIRDIRRSDAPMLLRVEVELFAVMVAVYNVEVAPWSGEAPLPDDLTLSVSYVDEGVILPPFDSLKLNALKLLAGTLSLSEWWRVETGQDLTDETVAELLIRHYRTIAPFAPILQVIAGVTGIDLAGFVPPTEGAAPPSDGPAPAVLALRASVGGVQTLADLQMKYEAGQISRPAVIALVTTIYALPPEDAERLFPIESDPRAVSAAPTPEPSAPPVVPPVV